MHRLRAGLLALLITGVAAGCTTQTSPGNIITGQVFLQMAVGTLNDSAGTISGLQTPPGPGPGTYANVVTSLRNNLGASAFQNPGNGYVHFPAAASLLVGGLFSYGQSPGAGFPNTNGVFGLPPAYNPANTLFSCLLVPAPPCGGYATGFIFTGQPATPGAYEVSTVVVVNGQNQPYGVTKTLPVAPTVLAAEAAPVYASGGATGGGTFTVAVPAGVTETLVVVLNNTGTTEVATALTHTTTAVLPAGTLALGTAYIAFAIGADYPLVEAGPPASTATMPTLTGAGGTADLTASGKVGFLQ
jgi:hypothetical protein